MQVQSTMGTVELAEVRQAGAAGPMMMFQLYVFKERNFVKQLVQRNLHRSKLIHSIMLLQWQQTDTQRHRADMTVSLPLHHMSTPFPKAMSHMDTLLGSYRSLPVQKDA